MTYYFEIKNIKTGDTYQGYGSNMKAIALQADWRVKDCKCIYRAPTM
jgi:hypothetical protein